MDVDSFVMMQFRDVEFSQAFYRNKKAEIGECRRMSMIYFLILLSIHNAHCDSYSYSYSFFTMTLHTSQLCRKAKQNKVS